MHRTETRAYSRCVVVYLWSCFNETFCDCLPLDILHSRRIFSSIFSCFQACFSLTRANPGFGEGKIIVLFQKFRFVLLDLCLGTAPRYMGAAPQNMGTASPKMGTTLLSRPLVTLQLRGSRPGDPRFLFFVLFPVCFSFIIIPRTVYFFF